MNTLTGLIIIAIGSFGQSSSYVPIKKVKAWSWESFWLIQGIFAWLFFPLAGAFLAVPETHSLTDVLTAHPEAGLKTLGYGVLWGVGGLTFGLSMRYLGVALGQSVALGTCAGFGTLFPAITGGTDLLDGEGLILLLGVCITLLGIAVIGYSGSLRTRDLTAGNSASADEKTDSLQEFSLTKGLLVALLAGVMSACFALGLDAGTPLRLNGGNELYQTLPATLLVTTGGFLTNAAYCLFQNFKNHTFGDYLKKEVWVNNLMFCMLAGALWYSQFFGLGIGTSFFQPASVVMAFSWCILMALNVIFSNVWGVLLKEWAGVSKYTVVILTSGLIILIFSLVFPNLF